MRFCILSIVIPFLNAHAQDDPATFKSGRTEVRLDVQVTRAKRPVTDLNRADFHVEDEGTPVELTYFAHDTEPIALVLLLDVSGSMRQFVEQMSSAATQALKNLRPGDRVAVMIYGRKPLLPLDFSTNFDEVAKAIRTGPFHWEKTDGGTSTNEAVRAATLLLRFKAGPVGRRAILIVTDNGGVNEGLNDDEVIRQMLNADTVLNAIAIGKAERSKVRSVNPFYTSTNVFALAGATGGEAIRAAHAQAELAGMLERIRARYALAYNLPAAGKPGEFHKVRVTLSQKGQQKSEVRVRSGYYGPPQP